MQLEDFARISLDMKTGSALDWKAQRKEALQAIASSKRILWQWDLGLFDRLVKPLENQEQFLALTLGIEHFLKTLWVEFERYTAGAIVYSGPQQFLEDMSPLKSRDVASDYMRQLTSKVPDALSLFIEFQEMHEDPLFALLISDPSVFGRIELMQPEVWNWQPDAHSSWGMLMPLPEACNASVLDIFRKKLDSIKTLYKKIPELHLISCWEGLDHLVYSELALSAQGRRQLQGFIAAGGDVIELVDFKGV